jgi:cell division protein FtsL
MPNLNLYLTWRCYLNRVVNTYSLNSAKVAQKPLPRRTPAFAPGRAEVRERIRTRAERRRRNKILPQWLIFVSVVAITFSFCVIVNVKTRSEMHEELQEQRSLHTEIERLQNENDSLADEVRRLQSDPAAIERAARDRLGMVRANEKRIIVPAR